MINERLPSIRSGTVQLASGTAFFKVPFLILFYFISIIPFLSHFALVTKYTLTIIRHSTLSKNGSRLSHIFLTMF